MDENYENLFNAVIVQACNDYVHAVRTMRKTKRENTYIQAERTKNECINFFRNGFYSKICKSVSADDLIKYLDEISYTNSRTGGYIRSE